MENIEGITGRVGRENGNKILEPEKVEIHKSVLNRIGMMIEDMEEIIEGKEQTLNQYRKQKREREGK
jgi:hypothetical protein